MSNLNEVVKIDSNESGNFSATKNRVTFVIPESDEVVDMTKSYINVNMSLNEDGGAVSASNVSFTDNGITHLVHPEMLVKNIGIECSKKGLLESLRRADVYASTKIQYEQDDEDKIDKNHLGLNAPRGKNRFALTPFRELNTDTASRELAHDVRIPLSVLGIGAVPQYSLSNFGRTTIKCEMNFDKLASDSSLGAADNAWTDNSNELGAMDDGAVNGTGADKDELVMTTTKVYLQEEWKYDCPFWVNQELAVTRTDKDGAATVTVRIASIALDATTNKLNITTAPAWATTANGAQTTTVTVVGVAPLGNDLIINSCELVVEYNADKNAPASVSFLTATTEEDNGGARLSLNKQYQIEPEAMSVMVCFPTTGGVYSNKQFSSYRMAIDNEPLTNRDVERASPLDYDRKARYLQNKGKSLQCLREKQLNKTIMPKASQTYAGMYDENNNAILEVVPVTAGMKTLGLEITSSGGHTLNEIIIFKEQLKTV